MPVDMEDILRDLNAGKIEDTDGDSLENSESKENEAVDSSEEKTTVSSAENKGESEEVNAEQKVVASGEGKEVATEATEGRRPKAFNRKEFSRQEKAEFSAAKWKRKFKDMKSQRDAIQAEYDEFKFLNPRSIRNPEDRAKFVMWKASTGQRLKDMDDDLNAMQHEHDEDVYESKIARCYNEESENDFRQLDEYYGETFSSLCEQKDPHNVIMDFLRNSEYEPAMRHVIYKNGKLQEDLFRDFGNPMITAVERTNILKRLERQVIDFYEGQGKSNPAESKQKPVAKPATAKRQVPQHLPPLNNAMPEQPSVRAATAQPSNNTRPQVTGSITRGGEAGGLPDVSSIANQMYKDLFKMGI